MLFKKRTIAVTASLFISASVLLFSCAGDKTKETPEVVSGEPEAEAQEVETTTSYILPSPLQIASIFKKSGLDYISGITNPSANISKYSTTLSKSIGMGIYSSDLAYCIINNQSQGALDHMKNVRKLAGDIGMSSIFDSESFMNRFEKNLGNEDSLAYIISDLQIEMDAFLEDNEQEHLAVIIFSSGWVESMYLGSKTIEQKKNDALTKRLGEQFVILENLIKALKVHSNDNEGIPALIEDLNSIKAVVDEFAFIKKQKENEDSEEEIIITEEEIAKLIKQIDVVRTKFINGNI